MTYDPLDDRIMDALISANARRDPAWTPTEGVLSRILIRVATDSEKFWKAGETNV